MFSDAPLAGSEGTLGQPGAVALMQVNTRPERRGEYAMDQAVIETAEQAPHKSWGRRAPSGGQ